MTTAQTRSPATLRGLGVAVLVIAGVAGIAGSSAPDSLAAPRTVPAAARAAVPASPGSLPAADDGVSQFRSVRTYQPVAVPVRLRIPAAGVDTRLQRLGLASDGTIAAPTRWQTAGWYQDGPRPGQQGPAVIAGHVDSRSGPAVFFRLAQLQRGDAVYVERADGSTIRFLVHGRRQVPKSSFPADLIYAPTLETSLLLITCGGIFDRSTGHYRDNIVVSAVPG